MKGDKTLTKQQQNFIGNCITIVLSCILFGLIAIIAINLIQESYHISFNDIGHEIIHNLHEDIETASQIIQRLFK
jgi:hypothetical protein